MKLEDKLKTVVDALEKNSEKIRKFEAEIKDMEVKLANKDQTLLRYSYIFFKTEKKSLILRSSWSF